MKIAVFIVLLSLIYIFINLKKEVTVLNDHRWLSCSYSLDFFLFFGMFVGSAVVCVLGVVVLSF
jgi:uncharacterized oligopeptide transporter (OPT) family protein